MHECITIDPKWLIELAPRSALIFKPFFGFERERDISFRFFKQADSSKLSKRKMMEKIEPL